MRTFSTLAVTALIPGAVLFAPGAGANPTSPDDAVAPISDSSASLPCCAETLPEAPAEAPAPVALAPEAPAPVSYTHLTLPTKRIV